MNKLEELRSIGSWQWLDTSAVESERKREYTEIDWYMIPMVGEDDITVGV
jgi:hypothetical protein